MGWLREHMRSAPGRPRSFGALARAALADPAWPRTSRSQPRSLAALFSKLDRGIEVEWLADRPEVQAVLASLLGVAQEELARAAGARPTAVQGRRIRLFDLSYASPLDLTTEDPPPGLPPLVLRPLEWGAVWWVAPSGSGRSLAGEWLSCRGLAAFISGGSFEDCEARLPKHGAVFVELETTSPRATLPPARAICVACPSPPPERVASAWTVVRSPEPRAWLGQLCEWIAERLPHDGHFSAAKAAGWLGRLSDGGHVDTLGTALGLASLSDRYGVDAIERSSPGELARRFARDRIAESRTEGLDSSWVRDHAFEALVALTARLLTDSNEPWDASRSFDEWVKLVPPEYQKSVDAEWVRASLSLSSSPLTVKELDRALRQMPPGAFRVVRALERADLLRRTRDGARLMLAPRWLARALVTEARRSLARGRPEEWGEALLLPHSAPEMLRALREEAAATGSPYDEVLEAEPTTTASSVVALETAFRIAGIGLLSGEDVPEDATLALWSQCVPLMVERDDGPHPRIEHPAGLEREEPMLDTGAFLLAGLAISEVLPRGRGPSHASLRPWHGETSMTGLRAVLDSIARLVSLPSESRPDWVLEAYALVDRLRAPSEAATRATDAHPLEWPGRMLDFILRDALDFGEFAAGWTRAGFEGLRLLAQRRGMDDAALAGALWAAWTLRPLSVDEGPLSPRGPHAAWLYEHAPPAALELLVGTPWIDRRTLPWGALKREAWHALLASVPSSLCDVQEAWSAMPLAVAQEALASVAIDALPIETLFQKVPDAVLDLLDRSLRGDGAHVAAVLVQAPAAVTGSVIERLARARRAPGARAARRAITSFLHDKIRERSEGYRSALELLQSD